MAKTRAVLGVEILGETARLVLAEVGESTITPIQTRTVTGAENLARTIRTLGKKPGAVVCSVPMEQAAVRILNLPPTTDETSKQRWPVGQPKPESQESPPPAEAPPAQPPPAGEKPHGEEPSSESPPPVESPASEPVPPPPAEEKPPSGP